MANVLFSNNASTTLAATAGSGATALTVATGSGTLFPAPTAGDYFYATLVNPSNTIEIVKCTARIGDTLTVVRGQDGTTAAAFAIGDKIELRPVAAALRDIMTVASTFPVTTARINDLAVTTAKLADLSVTGGKIAAGAVDGTKMAAGAAAGNLGFTPVTQGGSFGMLSGHTLALGWSGADVLVGVDVSSYRAMIEKPTAEANSGGYRGIPQNVQNVNYTVVLADLGGHIYHSSASAHTYTLPNTFPVGSTLMVFNAGGGGNVTIAAAGGTLSWTPTGASGNRTLPAGSMCWLIHLGGGSWTIAGFGIT